MIIKNIHSTVLQIQIPAIGYGDRFLVRDISFELAPGELVLLAGPNGTGKTTLLKALAEGGKGSENCATLSSPRKENAPFPPSARIILIPTNIPKVKGFTVEGFIETGCYQESDWRGRISAEAAGRMEQALELLGIQAFRKRDISTLSDGEFQKACLAVGLTRQADVLLLDEPTAHLDVENRIEVLRTLRDVAQKTRVLNPYINAHAKSIEFMNMSTLIILEMTHPKMTTIPKAVMERADKNIECFIFRLIP